MVSQATSAVRQYEVAARLSSDLVHAVIDIKTATLGLPGADSITPDVLERSRARARDIVAALEEVMTSSTAEIVAEQLDIPSSLAGWMRVTGRPVVRREELGRLHEHLDGGEPLDDSDIHTLDRITEVVSAQTSHLFRQVTRHAEIG